MVQKSSQTPFTNADDSILYLGLLPPIAALTKPIPTANKHPPDAGFVFLKMCFRKRRQYKQTPSDACEVPIV